MHAAPLLLALSGVATVAVVDGKKSSEEASPYPGMEAVIGSSVGIVMTPSVLATLLTAFALLGWAVRRNKAAGQGQGLITDFFREMLGLIVMVCCTFTPGPFLGSVNGGKGYEEWLAHCFGVIVSEKAQSPRIADSCLTLQRCLGLVHMYAGC
jgi:hypothetical protein